MNKNYCGHYTSQAGLIGIIETETIWATNIKFLNDEHEFQDTLELIKEIIPTSRITEKHPDHNAYMDFVELLKRELDSLDTYVTESIFTFSFSEETDLLSQWRGYCPDNNGFCLVFDVDGIYKQAKSEFDNVHLTKCLYEKDKKEKKLKDLLNSYWSKYLAKSSKKDKKEVMDDLAKEVMLLATHFKHPSFSEEKETRIVIILDYAADSNLKFKEGRFSVIPYLELPASRNNIKKICIGPTSNRKLSKRALEMFLEKTFGYPPWIMGDFELAFSKTPYRPW